MAIVDGKPVKVGDYVGFKSDTEQCGKISKINGNQLTLESTRPEGFSGDYIGGDSMTIVHARDCWLND